MNDQPKQTIEEFALSETRKWFGENNNHKVATYATAITIGYNHAQTEIEELRRDKKELVNSLISSIDELEEVASAEMVNYFKQLITKHK